MGLFNRTAVKPADDIVSLVKAAGVSLQKHGLHAERAAVYLVLDHSGSMRPYYRDGSVQRLAEQALGLSANLDDDGSVPLVYFGSMVDEVGEVRIGDHQGVIDRTHRTIRWGSTDYAAAIRHISAEYRASKQVRQLPALVIFQTDGEPDSRRDAEQALRDASHLPIFWAFVGFGGRVEFLELLDTLSGRAVDNASFFHAARPATVSDAELYDGITREYAQWLPAARAAGILAS
ncbi:VWA domain-containing protein [Kitasatospora sp. NBC_00240]|uniref:VWA domain-containing protein n=1 Tax=Kitasatospora sp. NBC_00240 TaxID=2903567 RepID=UPI002258C0CE|nr:VWA domain-containing protein [Kitasatospora sp. NBC_00240]MCX5209718.1 VWA domain-containing protein [Kitasatospora sp. NBC_00240]